MQNHPLNVIPQGLEKYLTLSLCKYHTFKDSLQFLGTSLEQIGQNLRASGLDKIKLLRARFPNATIVQLDLLLRKQVYPYEYMKSWDRFIETSLPPKEALSNKLRGQPIRDEEYAHDHKVWSRFVGSTILDYHRIYLK